jgi:D-amino-acid dehydrogenase
MRVVIVGSGLMGLVTAYFLRRDGADVCVVDRQDSAARETSFANGGMLHASQANPWNAPGIMWAALGMIGREDSPLLLRKTALPRLLRWGFSFVRQSSPERYAANIERNTRLANYSLSVMRELRAVEDLDYDFSGQGTLTIYRTQQEFDDAGRYAEQFSAGGVTFETLDRDGAVEIEPALKSIANDISGATYCPQDESGDAFKFCQHLQSVCQNNGVEFQFGVRATRLERDGDEITSVHTDSRRLRADAFVLSAGSFTPILTRTAGLRVPVQPVKGYSITAPVGEWAGPPRIPVIDEHLHAAVCPLGNRLRVAGTAEFAGYNQVLTKSRIDNLFQLLMALYPDYTPHLNETVTDRWTGLRPVAPDGVGIMGRTRLKNLYLNTGHGHLGWTMAAGAGKAVAAEVSGVESEFDLADYRLGGR